MKKVVNALLLLFAFSCSTKYSGFKEADVFLHYKLIEIGSEEAPMNSGDFVAVSSSFCKDSDCKEHSSTNVSFCQIDSVNSSGFWMSFSVNDRLVMILDSNSNDYWFELFNLQGKEIVWPIIIQLEILASFNGTDFIGNSGIKDSLLHFREHTELNRLLGGEEDYEDKSGCFLQILNWGDGDTIQEGADVTLEYKAFFSNGVQFDDTDKWRDSLKFQYGAPFQLILGLELAIDGLTEGSEAKIIIPSQLAFGKEGSSSGIVPPFEPLIYEIKIISVKKVEES